MHFCPNKHVTDDDLEVVFLNEFRNFRYAINNWEQLAIEEIKILPQTLIF